MKLPITTKLIAGCALLTSTAATFAHEGHGLGASSHWHATDTFGLLLVAGLAALAIWLSGGGKK
ncbi:MAG: hypothetical protein EOO25_04235 [Comamonadaceae bacterium]|nr:MAG: hypothetical protein EOO25_04235 [Comamonadaceae bacterium]